MTCDVGHVTCDGLQVLQDAEVVIQLVASDADAEGESTTVDCWLVIGVSCALSRARRCAPCLWSATPQPLLAVCCDVWLSKGLVAFQQGGQTQVIKSHLHAGGSVVHLAHLPAGECVPRVFP